MRSLAREPVECRLPRPARRRAGRVEHSIGPGGDESMAIRIRRLHPSFVGEVSGIDIARALSHVRSRRSSRHARARRSRVSRPAAQTISSRLRFHPAQSATGSDAGGPDGEAGSAPVPATRVGRHLQSRRDERLRAAEDAKRMYALANRSVALDASFGRSAPATRCSMRAWFRRAAQHRIRRQRAAYDALPAARKAEVRAPRLRTLDRLLARADRLEIRSDEHPSG